MISLRAVELTNVVYFKKARFPLDRIGLSVVYGQNKDSSVHPDKSNGSGKSLLFTTMMETLANEHPLIEGRHTASDAFQERGAVAAVEFDSYRVEKRLDGKSLKYDLFRKVDDEWQPTKVRKNSYVLDKLATLFPLTNTELYSLYYIDSDRPSEIQRGKHSERLKLLSTLLRLDVYDLIYEQVVARMRTMKEYQAALAEVEEQLESLKDKVTDDVDEEKLTSLRGKTDKLTRKRKEASELLHLKTVYDAYFPLLKKAHAAIDSGRKPDLDLETLDKELKRQLKQVTAAIESAKKRARQQAEIARLKARITELGDCSEVEDEVLEAARGAVHSLEKKLKAKEELLRQLDVWGSMDKPAGYQKTTSEQVAEVTRKVTITKQKLEEATQALADFKASFEADADCDCPTCHQTLTSKTIRTMLTAMEASVEELTDSVARLRKQSKHLSVCLDYTEWKAQVDATEKKLASLGKVSEDEVDVAREKVQSLEKAQKDFGELRACKKTLSTLAVDDEDVSLEDLASRKEQLSSAISVVDQVSDVMDSLKEAYELDAGTYDSIQLKQGIGWIDERLSALNDQVTTLSRKLGTNQLAKDKVRELTERKKELERLLEDLPVLKALQDAYGPKGMKNMRIQAACRIIEGNLNREAANIFSEPASFSIQVDETHMHIMITRGRKEKKTTDIRRLSGAESKAFNLLWPLCIYPLQPDSRRLNTVILDEPTAKMDVAGPELFVNKYLPRLLRVVPHVVVISPVPLPVDTANCHIWRVTRDGGMSTLEHVNG